MAIAGIRTSSVALWYLTRATGVVALVLLTLVFAFGVLNVLRFSTERWPRFVTDGVHRNMALLACLFLAVHITTTLLDSYVTIGLLDVVIPLRGSYRPVWLGLGAAAFDLLVAVMATSLLRARIGARTWRAVHWCAYAFWPLAVVHGFGAGSDRKQTWMLVIDGVCVLAVLAAVCLRLAFTDELSPAIG